MILDPGAGGGGAQAWRTGRAVRTTGLQDAGRTRTKGNAKTGRWTESARWGGKNGRRRQLLVMMRQTWQRRQGRGAGAGVVWLAVTLRSAGALALIAIACSLGMASLRRDMPHSLLAAE